MNTLTKADKLQEEVNELKARIEKGTGIVSDLATRMDSRYKKAKDLLDSLKDELSVKEQELDAAMRDFQVEVAQMAGRDYIHTEEPDGLPSTNCRICGKPVMGYPKPRPGYYVHYGCDKQ